MSVRWSSILLILLTLGGPTAFFALNSSPAGFGGGRSDEDVDLEFYAVTTGNVASVVTAVGEVEADEIINLSFIEAGRLEEILVSETDYVLEGDLLARLENDSARIGYDQAVLDLETAEIQLDDLLAPIDERDLRVAQANLDAARGQYYSLATAISGDDIRAAELAVEQAQTAYEAANERRILAGGFDDERDYTQLEAEIGEASFNLEIARLQLEDLRSQNGPAIAAAYQRVLQAERELERVQVGPSEIVVEQAEVRVQQAEAALQRTETALANTEVRAPFDGFVSDVYREVGSLVGPGTPVIEMVDVDPLRLTVSVDEIDVGVIEPGMVANVEVDALENVFLSARIDSISLVGNDAGDGIITYDAEIELDESDPRVRVGMTAEASIVIEEARNVIAVPNAFILRNRETGENTVTRLTENGEEESVNITLGLVGQNQSEIVDGISAGDILITNVSANRPSLFGG